MGASVKLLATTHKKSRNTIIRTITHFLNNFPKPKPIANSDCHIIIDGTWFGRSVCLVVYWDPVLKKVQWWRFTTGEKAEEVSEDLITLKRVGVVLLSATTDGGTGLVSGIKTAYPDIPIQRCLVHIQRRAHKLLSRKPKSKAGQDLQKLVRRICKIRTYEERDIWIGLFQGWCNQYKEFLNERTPDPDDPKKLGWFTHKRLRQARSSIRNAIPDMFHYLDNVSIPKTTNGLEGWFSALKNAYRSHRGLSRIHLEGFIAWYLIRVVNGKSATRDGY